MHVTAPAPLATATVATNSGPVTVVCEPVNEWLAITPGFGMDPEGKTWLTGTFYVTHLPTGTRLAGGDEGVCVNCCRKASLELAAMSADWTALTTDNSIEWANALPDDAKAALTGARDVSWTCDTEYCDDPTAEEV